MRLRTAIRLRLQASLRRFGWVLTRHVAEPGQWDFDQFLLLPKLGIRTVIDVGAHGGEFAGLVRGALRDCSLYCFEPLPDAFERLNERFAAHAGFEAFNVALGEKEAVLTMRRDEFAMSSSLLPMTALQRRAFPHTGRDAGVEQVRLARLDDVLGAKELGAPVLLKIDVQGYEDRVLAGAERVLQQTQYVLCEVSFQPLYEGQLLFGEISDLLSRRGFEYHGSLGQLLDAGTGLPLQADALYVRRGHPAS